MEPASIDYSKVLASGPSAELAHVREFLAEELPYVWLDAYIAMLPHRHNVHRIEIDGFQYLWDLSVELVKKGVITASDAVDDRLIAVHGTSRPNEKSRNDSRLRGRTLGPVEVVEADKRLAYDRGHAVGHKLGGGLDINIIPQTRKMNRGGLWRNMERYCQEHPGVYFFCRPIYIGFSSHPAEIEFGILQDVSSLWVNRFQNYGTSQELEVFERVYREKIRNVGAVPRDT